MPRVFFAMLPVFAGDRRAVLSRRGGFPTALVFAVHLHAFAFLVFTVTEAAKFTSVPIVGRRSRSTVVAVTSSSTRCVAARRVRRRLADHARQGGGDRFVYLLASVPAFFIILIWASLV